MSEKGKCTVCGRDATFNTSTNFDTDMVSCVKCGKYLISEYVEDYIKGKKISYDEFYSCLYFYLTHYRTNSKPYVILTGEFSSDENYHRVSVDKVMNLYPKTISERIDKSLLSFSKLNNELGSKIRIPVNNYFIPVIFAKTHKEAKYLFSIMSKMELITNPVGRWAPDLPIELTILYKGWERIDELQNENKTKNQGFIAMWFDACMNDIQEAIEKAIESAGYIPMIINAKEHNNQIVPEILYEIRNSDFLVADLTDERGGVYYEAGYALGQGKEVIITIDETKTAPHFDVAQKNQVRYETSEELEERLYKRIIATVGDKKQELNRA